MPTPNNKGKLKQLIRRLPDSRFIILSRRIKNKKTLNLLASYGITFKDIIYLLKTLKESDCISAYPEDDHDLTKEPPGDIWKFEKECMGLTLYIKMKVPYNKKKPLKILSIHD